MGVNLMNSLKAILSVLMSLGLSISSKLLDIIYIETVFSAITCRFPKSIHAVIIDGFLLKVATFIIVFTLESAFLS